MITRRDPISPARTRNSATAVVALHDPEVAESAGGSHRPEKWLVAHCLGRSGERERKEIPSEADEP